LTFTLGMNNNTDPKTEYYQDFQGNVFPVILENSSSEWNAGLSPGIEWHFAGTKRLSPYLGGQFSISYGQNESIQQRLENPYSGTIIERKNTNYSNGYLFPGIVISVGGMAGFDYYIAKSLFLGVEIGYAFGYYQANEHVVEETNEDKIETPGRSGMGFSPTIESNFRLGWVF